MANQPTSTTKEAPKQMESDAPFSTKVVRACAGQKLLPKWSDAAGGYMLPFVPTDGGETSIAPGHRRWLETGVKVALREGLSGRILYPYGDGRPGMMVPMLEIDSRYSDWEIVVPTRNENDKSALIFRPGNYIFVLRIHELYEP